MRASGQGISKGKFCDYCTCKDCQNGGPSYLTSLACQDGTNICNICYREDPCGLGCNGGSPEQPCKHKPKLKKIL